MNDKHINRAFEQMSPTKEQREKMFDRIKNEVLDEKRTKRIRFRKIPVIIGIASVFLMSTTTVYATNAFGAAEWITKIFDGGEALESSVYVPPVEKNVTSEDVDINILGVLASESNVHVIVELTRTDGEDFPEKMSARKEWIDASSETSFGMSYSRGGFEVTGNKAVVVYNVSLCGFSIEGQEMTINMGDFCDDEEFDRLYPRDIDSRGYTPEEVREIIEPSIFSEDMCSITFKVGSTVTGVELTDVTRADGIVINGKITPISISATFENIPDKYFNPEIPHDGFFVGNNECIVAMKDGREIVATGCAGASYGIGEGNKTVTEFTFDTVIEINEVDYVTLMGEKLLIAE